MLRNEEFRELPYSWLQPDDEEICPYCGKGTIVNDTCSVCGHNFNCE